MQISTQIPLGKLLQISIHRENCCSSCVSQQFRDGVRDATIVCAILAILGLQRFLFRNSFVTELVVQQVSSILAIPGYLPDTLITHLETHLEAAHVMSVPPVVMTAHLLLINT